MHLKILIHYFALFLSVTVAAAVDRMPPFVSSAIVNDLVVSVGSPADRLTASVTDRLVFIFNSKTNSLIDVFLLKQEYFCRVELFDSNNKPMQRTSKGRQLGARFHELKEFNEKAIQFTARGNWKMLPARPTTGSASDFPPASELFVIKKPGIYTMKLEFQVFTRIPGGTNRTLTFIKFPPVNYQLTK